MSAFSSKYDYYLAGRVQLSQEEQQGLHLFQVKGLCANCHTLTAPGGGAPLFTDFSYSNLGIPKNPANPVYRTDPDFVDQGLGGFLATRPDYAAFAQANNGKQRVPTLRNLDKSPLDGAVKAYGHNGYFKTLEGIVHFYNTRDTKPACPGPYTEAEALANDCWPAPEVADNMNMQDLGNLHLTEAEERALVAFLQTLSDGYPLSPGYGLPVGGQEQR